MSLSKRHATLSWAILEAKILYYSPYELPEDFVNTRMPSDAVYDAMEVEYLGLCRELGLENTLVHKAHPGFETVLGKGMIEVDWHRDSVKLAYEKLVDLWKGRPNRHTFPKVGENAD